MSKKVINYFIYFITLSFLCFIPILIRQSYLLHIIILIGINILWASSLRFIALSGQFSLAHGGMISIGAYTSALLVKKVGFSFWVTLPLAGLTSMIIASLLGYAFTRLKGMYFTMLTLFFTEFIRLTAEQWSSLTGGVAGVMNIPKPNPIAIPHLLNIDFSSKGDFYYLIFIIVLIALLLLYAIESSRIGMILSAIKQNDSLAESIGINTTFFKVFAFSVGCFFAGIGGAFYAHYLSAFYPQSFSLLLSINIFIFMIVGGIQHFFGPIIGAIILTLVPELASTLKEYQPIVFSIVLLTIVFFLREGLVGLPQRIKEIKGKGVHYAKY